MTDGRNDDTRGLALSGKIKAARIKKGMSQEALAAAVGVSTDTIRKIEQKKTASPGVFLVADIASLLKLNIKNLVKAPRRKG
jgi:DNA-binding XRE family transcriptional regulator